MRLRKMLSDHSIFSKMAFTENSVETSLFGSNKSATLLRLYKESKSNSTCLIICIIEIEQSLQNGLKTAPPCLVEAPSPPRPTS